MKKTKIILRVFSLSLAFIFLPNVPAVFSKGYFVDYQHGDDSLNGLDPTSAWKHAPGDKQATQTPRKIKLTPGDVVLFKGGVEYSGVINLRFDGSSSDKIIYAGDRWGDEKAIISGAVSQSLNLRKCLSLEDCYNHPNWKNLLTGDLTGDVHPFGKIYLDGEEYRVSQTPDLSDPFWYDDTSQYHVIPKEESENRLTETSLILDGDDNSSVEDWGSGYVSIWGKHNAVRIFPVEQFDPVKRQVKLARSHKPYFDRKSYYSTFNRPQDVSLPGEVFFDFQDAKILIFPRSKQVAGSSKFTYSYLPRGFDIAGKKNIRISGFKFVNQLGKYKEYQSGAGIINNSKGAENIEIDNNVFENAYSYAGLGAIQINFASNVNVRDNIVRNNQRNSGIRFYKSRNVTIENNEISRIGRTGIRLIGCHNVNIVGNYIEGIMGVHGNAMSVYLLNTNILIYKNYVDNSRRALTYHGNHKSGEAYGLWIIGNTFFGSLNSWGKKISQVYILNNLIVGEHSKSKSVTMPDDDMNIYFLNNIVDGWVVGKLPKTWRAFNNVYVGLSWKQAPKFDWRLDFNGDVDRSARAGLIRSKTLDSRFDQLVGAPIEGLLPKEEFLRDRLDGFTNPPGVGPLQLVPLDN